MCGVYLRNCSPDSVFITAQGRLILGGLSGATYAGGGWLTEGIPSYYASAFKGGGKKQSKDKEKDSRRDSSGSATGGDRSGKKRSREGEKPSDGSAKKKDRRDSKGGSTASRDFTPPHLSMSDLPTTSPEVICGGSATAHSSAYTAAVLCSYILCGKPPVSAGDDEQKHLNYLFRILGTPRKEDYLEQYRLLPLASVYGSTIRNKDKDVECKNRVFKAMRERLPLFILDDLSKPGMPVEEEETQDKAVDGDNGFIIDVIKVSCVSYDV